MKKTGLLGYPLSHSKSPQMHNAAYKALSLNFEYNLYEAALEDVAEVVAMFRGVGFSGFNVTIPYKQTVMEYLDEIDDEAKRIGAVNTVVNRLGKLVGYNTDGRGFLQGLKHYHNFEVAGKKLAIFGSGGAARAIAISAYLQGAHEISVGGRDSQKTSLLTKEIDDFAYEIYSEEFFNKVAEADLVINTTPLGMHPNDNTSVVKDVAVFCKDQLVFDAVYNPQETLFLQQAQAQGAKAAYGYEMLLFQGVIAFELFTSSKAPVQVMEKALLTSL